MGTDGYGAGGLPRRNEMKPGVMQQRLCGAYKRSVAADAAVFAACAGSRIDGGNGN